MSNLKLKKLISLILCGTFMNCSISYAMFSDNLNNSFDIQKPPDSINIFNNSFDSHRLLNSINLNNSFFDNESNLEKNYDNQEQIKDDDDKNVDDGNSNKKGDFDNKNLGRKRGREQSRKKEKKLNKKKLNKRLDPKNDAERYNRIIDSKINEGNDSLTLKLVERFPNDVQIKNLPKLQELYTGFGGDFKVESFDKARDEIKALLDSWQNKPPTSKGLKDPAKLSVPAQHVNNFILDLFKLGRMYSGKPILRTSRTTKTITITFTTDGRGFLHTSVFDGANLGQNGLGMKNDFSDIEQIYRSYAWWNYDLKLSQKLRDKFPKKPDSIKLYLNRTEELVPFLSDNEESYNGQFDSSMLKAMCSSKARRYTFLEKIPKTEDEFIKDLEKILSFVRKFKKNQYQKSEKVQQTHPKPKDKSFLSWLLYFGAQLKPRQDTRFDTPFGDVLLKQLYGSWQCKGGCNDVINEIINLYRNLPQETKKKFITFLNQILELKCNEPEKIIKVEDNSLKITNNKDFPQYNQLINNIDKTKFVEDDIKYLNQYHPGRSAANVEKDVKKLFAKIYVAIFLIRPLKVGDGGKFSHAMVRQQNNIYNPPKK